MDDIIDRSSDEFRELIGNIETAIAEIGQVSAHLKPAICNERYLTGDEVCCIFHIGKRTLQEYRDSRVIPYTSVGGRILYPESGIEKLLEKNHVCPYDF